MNPTGPAKEMATTQMSEGVTDGIWVVRVWREDDDRPTVRARITATTGGAGAGGTMVNEWAVAATSIGQIESDLHEFLLGIISGRPR